MEKSFTSRLGLVLAVAVAVSTYGSLALAADPGAGTSVVSLYGDPAVPDISGLWQGTAMGIPGKGVVSNSGQTADGSPPIYWAPWPLPYTPEYQKIFDERVAAEKKGRALGDTGSKCLPFGLPNMVVSMHYPVEIVETPGEVTIYPFGTFPIVIWTDGRPHPANLALSYNGHSIGHWEGDTLMVDTVGINAATPLDSNRDPHSAKLHMKWSIRRVAPDTLHVHETLYDDGAFTEPVTITNIWHRKSGPGWQILDDQSCFENNQDVPPPAQASGFIKF